MSNASQQIATDERDCDNKLVPEGWILTNLGELCTYVTSGSRDWSKYYAQAGALFVRTQDINKNKLAPIGEIARVVPDLR